MERPTPPEDNAGVALFLEREIYHNTIKDIRRDYLSATSAISKELLLGSFSLLLLSIVIILMSGDLFSVFGVLGEVLVYAGLGIAIIFTMLLLRRRAARELDEVRRTFDDDLAKELNRHRDSALGGQ